MKLSKIIFTIAATFSAIGLTACNDEDNNAGIVTGADVAVIEEYSPSTVTFGVETTNGSTVLLQSPQNAIFNPDDYPVGSRIYITYSMMLGQTESPILITLSSARPVTTISIEQVSSDECKLDYRSFTINPIYLAGNYINMVATIEKGKDRIWRCLMDTENSKNRIANLYLTTQAESTEYVGTTAVVSINVANLIQSGMYDELHLHVNNQQDNDFTYKFSIKK